MAHRLKWWIAATLAACIGVAVAYLPPRSTPVLRQRFFQIMEAPTPYRLRVQVLAEQWRAAALELRLFEDREQLRPELERRRAQGVPGPALLVSGADALSDSARGLVRAALDTAWSRLGLGESKVSVGVVLDVEFGVHRIAPGSLSDRPTAPVYLLPDSTDRSTCMALIPISYWGRAGLLKEAHPARSATLESGLRSGLGPCAFYAAFGNPGNETARWLEARRFDLAVYPWGDSAQTLNKSIGLPDRTQPWFWMWVYQYPPRAVACMAGRAEACRAAVLARGDGDATAHVVTRQRLWWQPRPLAGVDRYLGDVVKAVGPERFARFWNSDLPIDTSLVTALRMPVGEWTRRWQAALTPPIRLGAAAPLGATLLALSLSLAAVVLVAVTVARREVR